MLINLSNHPSTGWPQKQTVAAVKQYGEIADLPFPAIDPEADTDEVKRLAEQYLIKCLTLIAGSNDSRSAVHLMGELTFSFYLLALLQKAGIACLASTTRRNASTGTSGEKITLFQFVRFREFPHLFNTNSLSDK